MCNLKSLFASSLISLPRWCAECFVTILSFLKHFVLPFDFHFPQEFWYFDVVLSDDGVGIFRLPR